MSDESRFDSGIDCRFSFRQQTSEPFEEAVVGEPGKGHGRKE